VPLRSTPQFPFRRGRRTSFRAPMTRILRQVRDGGKPTVLAGRCIDAGPVFVRGRARLCRRFMDARIVCGARKNGRKTSRQKQRNVNRQCAGGFVPTRPGRCRICHYKESFDCRSWRGKRGAARWQRPIISKYLLCGAAAGARTVSSATLQSNFAARPVVRTIP